MCQGMTDMLIGIVYPGRAPVGISSFALRSDGADVPPALAVKRLDTFSGLDAGTRRSNPHALRTCPGGNVLARAATLRSAGAVADSDEQAAATAIAAAPNSTRNRTVNDVFCGVSRMTLPSMKGEVVVRAARMLPYPSGPERLIICALICLYRHDDNRHRLRMT